MDRLAGFKILEVDFDVGGQILRQTADLDVVVRVRDAAAS
jgi:hypothetical protein